MMAKKITIDFEGFIKHSQHQDIKKYQDLILFKQFNIRYGELIIFLSLSW